MVPGTGDRARRACAALFLRRPSMASILNKVAGSHVHRAGSAARDRTPVSTPRRRRLSAARAQAADPAAAHRHASAPTCRTSKCSCSKRSSRGAVFMMGDNPALPRMPDKPTLLDFYRLRFGRIARRHHCLSAKLALEAGHDEKVVIACFLHDISNGALVRSDHGYWSAQLIGAVRQRGDRLGDALSPAAALLRRRVGGLRVSRRRTGGTSATTTSRRNTSGAITRTRAIIAGT